MLLDSFLSRSTQRTEARTWWLGKGSILGKRQIRILKGIKGTLLAHCAQDFNRKLDHKPLRELHWKIPPLGPWALPKLWALNPHFPHSEAGSMCAPPSAEVNRVFSEKQTTVLGRGKNTHLSYSATFWKTKERFPANSLASCKNQRGHKRLRILLQGGARSAEQVYPYKIWENPRYKQDQWKISPTWRQLIKFVRGDCYFKCESSNRKPQGTWRIKELCHHQKIIINIPITKLNDTDLADKEFKIAVLRKLKESTERR